MRRGKSGELHANCQPQSEGVLGWWGGGGGAASRAARQAVRQVWGLNQLRVSEVRLESLTSKFKAPSHIGTGIGSGVVT